MFIVCKMKDGRWKPQERKDSLEEARKIKLELLEEGFEAEVLVRLKEGYYVVSDSGDSYQLSSKTGD